MDAARTETQQVFTLKSYCTKPITEISEDDFICFCKRWGLYTEMNFVARQSARSTSDLNDRSCEPHIVRDITTKRRFKSRVDQ